MSHSSTRQNADLNELNLLLCVLNISVEQRIQLPKGLSWPCPLCLRHVLTGVTLTESLQPTTVFGPQHKHQFRVFDTIQFRHSILGSTYKTTPSPVHWNRDEKEENTKHHDYPRPPNCPGSGKTNPPFNDLIIFQMYPSTALNIAIS